uniref:insulin receptor substrate 2-like isoform X2 n=1 Tax=Doryrhamphus excisus TaxID=161450 RepID=UPI0025ADDBFC|nr:insulin receptor substrate 2-like isoform X2 [Doryrhamphus excisus]
MKETVDRHKRRASSSEQMWSSCSEGETQIRAGEPDRHVGGLALYRNSRASIPLVGTLMSSCGQQSDVVKQGYLGKLERNHRRYFVLRAGSHTGPSRLEWYKSLEKFAAMEKSSGKAVLFGPSKQGVIYLRCCIGVGCLGSSRKGLTVALYAQDQTVVLVAEDQQDQEGWYRALKKMLTEEREDEEQGCDDEDDGYCTLPPASFFTEVWQVSVKPRGLGRSKCLAGELRLCLTATSLILAQVGACCDLPSITIPLLSVRRFGHLDGSFFFELGRSVPIGPGEIWVEAKDQGNPAVAQHIHEAVRDAVRALRVLPDFSRSPTTNHSQLLVPKRCRPKYRDKSSKGRPVDPLLTQAHAHSDTTEPDSSPSKHDNTTPERDGYMDMMMHTGSEGTCAAPGEEAGQGYMMMSPQASRSSSAAPWDEYVAMASPQKDDRPAFISPQTSRNRHHPSNHQLQLPPPFGPTCSPWSPIVLSAAFPSMQTQAWPLAVASRSPRLQAQAAQLAGRRSRLSSCLLSCLQADR